jgi:TolB-like protein/DNA-binding winged helix-turn-helix (wHTH) protein/Flp pilus assembly protein TadD
MARRPETPEMEKPGKSFRIGDCEVRPEDGTVLSPRGLRRLGPRPMAVLAVLAAHPGKVFSREELMAKVWSGLVVSDETLSRCISDLRQVLDDNPRSPRYIETLPRRGYRVIERPDLLVDDSEGAAGAETAGTRSLEKGGRAPRIRRAGAWLAATLAVLLVVAGWSVMNHETGQEPSAADPALAENGIVVLPFVNLSDNSDLEYFSDGLSEELIHRLASVEALAVVARTSAFAFKGSNKDVRDIGRALGVRYVLEGSVRSLDDRVRLGAQLIDVRNGFHLFSRVYERPFSDLFAIQEHVALEVGAALEPRLPGLPEGLQNPAKETADFPAYQAYLQGRYYLSRRTAKDLEKAIESFDQSLLLEPNRSKTYSALAAVYAVMPYYVQMQPLSAIGSKARFHAETAIRLDDENAEAHSIMGMVEMTFGRDWARAQKSFARALELSAGDAQILNLYGDYFYLVGDYVSAEQMESAAAGLEPLSAIHQLELGLVYDFSGQYDRAIQQAKLAIALNEELPNAWWQLCRSYIHAGTSDLAEFELRNNAAKLGRSYVARVRALLAAEEGDRATLLLIAEDEEHQFLTAGGSPTIVAYHFALAGDDANAAAYIRRAIESNDAILVSPMYFFLPEDWGNLSGVQQALGQAGLRELHRLRRRHIASGVGRVLPER